MIGMNAYNDMTSLLAVQETPWKLQALAAPGVQLDSLLLGSMADLKLNSAVACCCAKDPAAAQILVSLLLTEAASLRLDFVCMREWLTSRSTALQPAVLPRALQQSQY